MNYIIRSLCIFLILLLLTDKSFAQNEMHMSVGLQTTNYLSSGEGGNEFKTGIGGNFEINYIIWSENIGIAFGMSYSSIQNQVFDSVIEGEIGSFYLEYRHYFTNQGVKIFGLAGLDWNMMEFEMARGTDYHYLLSLGAGLHFEIADEVPLQMKIKPYYIFSNSLDQNFGISLNFNIGMRF